MKKLAFVFIGLFILVVSRAQDKGEPTKENYYFSTQMEGEFDMVVEQVKVALKEEGFGVISEIDVQQKMNEKVEGATMGRYLILGACNPHFAYKALQHEKLIGTMLPCNVVIHEIGKNKYEVAAVNPVASMQAVENEELGGIATSVKEKLARVIDNL